MESNKKQSLIERLNNGMAAIDLPAGSLVRYKSSGAHFLVRSTAALKQRYIYPDLTVLESIEVEKNAYLLYLGIDAIGPRAIRRGNSFEITLSTIYVHQFYHGEKMVFLEIGRPDLYYTVFRRHCHRVDNRNNLCR